MNGFWGPLGGTCASKQANNEGARQVLNEKEFQPQSSASSRTSPSFSFTPVRDFLHYLNHRTPPLLALICYLQSSNILTHTKTKSQPHSTPFHLKPSMQFITNVLILSILAQLFLACGMILLSGLQAQFSHPKPRVILPLFILFILGQIFLLADNIMILCISW